ncbi:MAG: hypothetical protein ABI960_02280 [Candidatus Eisenbacteria bacterium]
MTFDSDSNAIEKTRFRAAPLAAVALLVLAGAGCGHSVEPRAPYDTVASIPVPESLGVALDPGGNVVLRWHASAAARRLIDGWRIERHRSEDDPLAIETLALVRDTVYFDQTIADGERASYRVSAVTAVGVAGAPAVSPPIRCDRVAPVPPRDVVVTPRSAALEVAFVASPSIDVAEYELRVDRVDQSGPPVFGFVSASPGIVGNLVPGTAYGVTVAAIDSAGRYSFPSGFPVSGVPDP